MIYLIKAQEIPLIKIGYSGFNIVSRASAIQTGNPFRLFILGVFEGTLNYEKILHTTFSRDYFRGEWFFYTKEIADFLLCDKNLLLFFDKDGLSKIELEKINGFNGEFYRPNPIKKEFILTQTIVKVLNPKQPEEFMVNLLEQFSKVIKIDNQLERL